MGIKIGIYGYGNLGKGVEDAIAVNKDMELIAIFTRRDPSVIDCHTNNATIVSVSEVEKWKEHIDVMILCGGSATDLPQQTPMLASMFNVIDSFDTHAKIQEHFKNVNRASQEGKKIAIISSGWDPGAFSINRVYADAFLPGGKSYTFWGKGVSQGHSDAIRRIEGVKDARQYTIPIEEAVNRVRNGEKPEFTTREKHLRECFVVLEDGVDPAKIEEKIKNMPNYFADYDTIVHFISEEELMKNHLGLPHGGSVFHSAETGNGNMQVIEYTLKLDSNPEFTGSILLAYARAAYRLNNKGQIGARTVLDIAPALLSMKTQEQLLKMV